MHVASAIELLAAAVSLFLGLCTIAWVAHKALGRVESAVKKVEGNTRELVNNGGSSMKDEMTPGKGGMVDRQMKIERQVDVLVDALTTVRTRLETADEALQSQIGRLSEATGERLRQLAHDLASARTSLGLHIEVADKQTVAIGTALAQLGADVRLSTTVPEQRPVQDMTVVIPVLPTQ